MQSATKCIRKCLWWRLPVADNQLVGVLAQRQSKAASASPTPSKYFVQLDGIRALAVTAVAIYHWHNLTILGVGTELGSAGVNLFFVISGFLITRILIAVRSSVEQSQAGAWFALRAFFVRRFLRLFPALFVYLAVAVATGFFADVEGLPWHLAYLSNFRVHQLQVWTRGAGHLWSLAIEEQFYLGIPFVVLWLRPSWLRAVFTAGIVVAAAAAFAGSPTMDLLPPAAFGGLFFGCLTATILDRQDDLTAAVHRVAPFWIVLLVVGFAYNDFELLRFTGSDVAAQTTFNLGASGLVWRAAHERAGWLLASTPIVRIGQLSYGIYLWHFFALWLSEELVGATSPTTLRFAVMVTLSLCLAHVSYVFIEQPFTAKKSAFPYLRPV